MQPDELINIVRCIAMAAYGGMIPQQSTQAFIQGVLRHYGVTDKESAVEFLNKLEGK